MKPQEAINAELIALAALVIAEAVHAWTSDQERYNNGYAPCFGENASPSDTENELRNLLHKIGYKL